MELNTRFVDMDENTHNYYEIDYSVHSSQIEGSSIHEEPHYDMYERTLSVVRPVSMNSNPAYAENSSNYDEARYDHLNNWRQRGIPIENRPAKSATTVVLFVVCVVALFSLLLSLAALSVTIVKVQTLTMELGILRQESESFRALINMRQVVLEGNQTRIQSEVNTLTEHLNSIDTTAPTNETEIRTLVVELDSLRTQLNTTQYQLEQEQAMLQTSIGALARSSQFNSSADPFQNCYQEVENCFASPMDGRYWRQCNTAQLPIDRPGQFTTNMHCEYTSERFPGLLQESAYLRPDNQGNVQCVCEVTYPQEDAPGHFVIPNDVAFQCVLVITRCPHSQT